MNESILKKFAERRSKRRFGVRRELRFKVVDDRRIVAAGTGHTIDISSAGVAFHTPHELPAGGFVELAISWPVLLDSSCPMLLIVFGRLVRGGVGLNACTMERYEFRTQPREWQERGVAARSDRKLRRWADSLRKDDTRPDRRAAAVQA
jgi:hypothetical protein